MTDPSTLAFVAATAVALLTSGAFLASMWRRRAEPLALALLGVAAVSVLAVAVDFTLVRDVLHESSSEFWIFFVYLVSLVGMGLWVYFTFQYTGRGRRVTILVATAVVGAIVLTVVTAVLSNGVWGDGGDDVVNVVTGISTLSVQALTIVSVFMLVGETVETDSRLFREALAQAGGILTLGFAPFLSGVYQAPIAFPVMVTISSCLFLVAIHHYALFETLPVARVAGRDRVINEIADPVVVVDRGGVVQDLNPAGEACFGTSRSAAVGQPLAAVVPGPNEPAVIAGTGDPIPLQTRDGRTLTVSVDRVADSHGRLFGYMLVYRDITDRRERERRLGVLNQLLVGAVRDRMETVAATARRCCCEDPDATDPAEKIWGITTELTELVTRTRDVERAITEAGDGSADLTAALSSVAAADDGISLILPDADCSVAMDAELLETAIAILLADVFGDTPVDVAVTVEDDVAVLRITPTDGATLPARRRRIDEFALELAGLAVEDAGGSLTVLDSDPQGRGVVVRLPRSGQRQDDPDDDPGAAAADQVGGVQ